MLQRVAVCCSELKCFAVRCSVLQCVAVRCRVLQRVLQSVAENMTSTDLCNKNRFYACVLPMGGEGEGVRGFLNHPNTFAQEFLN